ncbi:carbamate kinase [Cryptosporangium minutisporangium]|uniref:Carbamate kinase n=1 Tax=Cryptosporangium minutisporangium TaxID=113569 RepID=A0ABP6T8Y4_9ACTN
MRIVVALGGNALLERGEKPDAAVQRRHVRRAAAALVPLAAEHELVVCHGNGPQVGLLALESAADPALSRPYPLDVLDAQTQGMIGYWLVQELRNAGLRRSAIAVLTQTVVDAGDPAFATPTKFVGQLYDRAEAERLAAERDWRIAPDGAGWRRVVPSPRPRRIVERDTVAALLDTGSLVVCGGGGGIPVVEAADGRLTGVEAVVDKDLTAALLAIELHADRLIILTDVTAVMRDFGTPRQSPIGALGVDELAGLGLPAGSMGPKLDACGIFTAATGNPSAIGAVDDAAAILHGEAGTWIRPAPAPAGAGR